MAFSLAYYLIMSVTLLTTNISNLCFAAWTNAKYELMQDNTRAVSSDQWMAIGLKALSPYWCGVDMDLDSHVSTLLHHTWCRAHSFQSNHAYLIKRHQRDEYQPPFYLYHNSYSDERLYFATVPGLFNIGSRVDIQLTPHDPWNKFAVTLWNIFTGLRPYKSKIWKSDNLSHFVWEDANHYEQDWESEMSAFPIISGQQNTLSYYVTSSDVEMHVNHVFYHSYAHRHDPSIINTVSIWFEGLQDSLFLHSVDIWLPTITSD